MTDWSIDVFPETITPSTGTVSPGSTRTMSPTRTSCAETTRSSVPDTTRAVRGVRRTSRSIPARALKTVRSSSRAPSCMIKATSPAANVSPMATEAISARDTSTSALMSKRVTNPMNASRRMGIPHRMMAAHAASNGNGDAPARLSASAAPDAARSAASFFQPPHSRSFSSFSIISSAHPIYPMGYIQYTHMGILRSRGKTKKTKAACLRLSF